MLQKTKEIQNYSSMRVDKRLLGTTKQKLQGARAKTINFVGGEVIHEEQIGQLPTNAKGNVNQHANEHAPISNRSCDAQNFW